MLTIVDDTDFKSTGSAPPPWRGSLQKAPHRRSIQPHSWYQASLEVHCSVHGRPRKQLQLCSGDLREEVGRVEVSVFLLFSPV